MRPENFRWIYLTRGYSAKVSPQDYTRLCKHRWRYDDHGRGDDRGYAVRTETLPREPGEKRAKRRKVYMHREITNCPADLVVDHANNDRLDNRRKNLRVTTWKHNAKNCVSFGAAGYRGVDQRGRNSFRARLNDILIGTFKSAHEAAEAYDIAALKAHGEFAFTNFDRALYAIEDASQTEDERSEAVRPFEDVPF